MKMTTIALIASSMLGLTAVVAGAASNATTSSCITTSLGYFQASNSSVCACSQLQSLYPSALLTPESANYTAEATNFWDIRSNLSPACIFLPSIADQVEKAVRIFNKCNAPFAIRGGGHMNYPGSNSIDGGVLLALNGLNERKVLNNSIEVGPGNRWVDVYAELEPHGLYTIGGRLKTIGVPGLTLIGGVHYFINKYGFTMDNVLSYDVVLGNGTLVVASATSNPDLFWALKGGANNFGVVTKFELKAHKIPKLSTTIQQFNETAVRPFIQAVCDLVEANDATVGAGAVITISYNITTGEVSPSLLAAQEGTESPPPRFANFSAIPSVRTINNVTTPTQWHNQFDSPNQMFRIQFGVHTVKPAADRIYEMYLNWKNAVEKITDVQGLYPTFVLNLAPKSAVSVSKNNGIGNVWGLDDQESYIWWQVATSWALAQDDKRMTEWGRSLIDRMHAENKEMGLATEFIYIGDAGEYQDPLVGYAPGNVAKMRQIRDKYDADGVFTRLNWGGFKLGY